MRFSQIEWMGLWTGAGLLCSWIYLPRWFFILPASFFVIFYAHREYGRREAADQKKMLQKDFILFLEILSGSLNAGSNFIQSLRGTSREMGNKGLGQELFLPALQRALRHYDEGENFSVCMRGMAEELDLPVIHSFVDSLLPGMERGADLEDLVESYHRILIDTQQLNEEREAKLYASKREQNLLFAMPFILMAMMRLGGFLPDQLNLTDILIRLFSLLLLALAWKWCQYILNKNYRGEN